MGLVAAAFLIVMPLATDEGPGPQHRADPALPRSDDRGAERATPPPDEVAAQHRARREAVLWVARRDITELFAILRSDAQGEHGGNAGRVKRLYDYPEDIEQGLHGAVEPDRPGLYMSADPADIAAYIRSALGENALGILRRNLGSPDPAIRFHSPEAAYVQPGENGLLARPNDPAAMLEAVERVLADRPRFSQNAYAYARTYLTLDQMVNGLEAAIRFVETPS